MTEIQENILKINQAEESFENSECRYDALKHLKDLDALYEERVKLLKDEDVYGFYHSNAVGSSKSIKMIIKVLEKL